MQGGEITLFAGTPTGPAPRPTVIWTSPVPDTQPGWDIAVGDFHGDSVDDVAACSSEQLYVTYGAVGQDLARTSLQLHSLSVPNDSVCTALAAGDVNADGIDDVVIGAPEHDRATGVVYLLQGGPAGLPLDPSHSWAGEASRDALGGSLAVGDLDGDGDGDVVVGAPDLGDHRDTPGAVRVFAGSATALAAAPAASWTETGGSSLFGSRLAVGHLDHDGDLDLAVSDTTGRSLSLFAGLPLAFPAAAATHTWETGGLDSRLGAALDFVDLDGDGAEELLAGAPGFDVGGEPGGRVLGWTATSVGGCVRAGGACARGRRPGELVRLRGRRSRRERRRHPGSDRRRSLHQPPRAGARRAVVRLSGRSRCHGLHPMGDLVRRHRRRAFRVVGGDRRLQRRDRRLGDQFALRGPTAERRQRGPHRPVPGHARSPPSAPDQTWWGDRGAEIGTALAVGDVDGIDDLVHTSREPSPGGRIAVWPVVSGGTLGDPLVPWERMTPFDEFYLGPPVVVGDVNGDGYDDIVLRSRGPRREA